MRERARSFDGGERPAEGALFFGRKTDDDIAREVELPGQELEPTQVDGARVAPPHRAQHSVVARLERNMEVLRRRRGLPQRRDQRRIDVVDLDRAQPQPAQTLHRSRRAHQPGEVEPRRTVTKAAEVDPCQDDLAVTLLHATPDLAEHLPGATAAGAAADERDHAELAAKRATVLDLDEGANTIEAVVGARAPDRAGPPRR